MASFGKPTASCSGHVQAQKDLPVTELSGYREMAVNDGFADHLRVQMVTLLADTGVVVIRFTTDKRTLEWVRKHEKAVKGHMNKATQIQVGGRPRYHLNNSGSGAVLQFFSEEEAAEFRVYLFLDEKSRIEEDEVLSENMSISLFA
jgi:hypothetical protein